jgi:ATP-dependent DNA helicase RecG
LSEKERTEFRSELDDLSKPLLEEFIKKARLNVASNSLKFYRILSQLGILEFKDNKYLPTGLGLLLFGERPQLVYQNALIRATFKTKGRGEDIETIEGPLISQADKIQQWYESHIGKQIDRSSAERKVTYDYPLVVFREAIINAIVHRDYDIDGAPIYFEINDDAIIIKSPGEAVKPITLEQIKRFNAPSLSRNPKIMYVFDQMELVEQRGLGFLTIKDLPLKYSLPLPLVSYDAPYMVLTFPRNGVSLKKISPNKALKSLNEEELKGFDFVNLKGNLTRKEYEEHFGFDKKKAERHFKVFVEKGLVERKGSGPSIYYEAIAT